MKTNIILVLALSVLALQCKEDEPEVVNQLDLLPPATQTGKNTFGCLVNGQAWVPETSNDMVAMYQAEILHIGGKAYPEIGEQNISFTTTESEAIANETFDLTNAPSSFARSNWYTTDSVICLYDMEDTREGTLTISHFDREEFIVSGTFAFTMIKGDCDTLRVTDGRFDMHYIP